jgi:hypothetical protein
MTRQERKALERKLSLMLRMKNYQTRKIDWNRKPYRPQHQLPLYMDPVLWSLEVYSQDFTNTPYFTHKGGHA